jgi:hypothetical protein
VPVFVHPAHRPLYVVAKTAVPQLIWCISSSMGQVILRAWGIKNLDTVSPWDPQNITYSNSHNRYASNCLLLVGVLSHERGLQKFKIQ